MVNDTSTLNGALSELGETLATNITAKGVTASASDGLTTLANKVLQISGDTPTPSTVIYEDDCSVDNTSDYGSSISLRNSGTSTLAYNSNEYYTITNTKSQAESFIPITELTGLTTDFTLEYDSYVQQVGGSSGLVIYNSSTAWEKLTDDASSDKKYWYGYNDGSFHETAFYGTETSYQKWVHYKYTVQGKIFSMEVTYNDEIIAYYSTVMHFSRDSSTKIGLDSEWSSNTVTRYKNIVVKTLGGGGSTTLFEDTGSANGLSNYGNDILLEGGSATTMTYDSAENAYKITTPDTKSKCIPIDVLTDEDNFKFEADIKPVSRFGMGFSVSGGTGNGCVIGFSADSDNLYGWKYTNGSFGTLFNDVSGLVDTDYLHITVTVEGTSLDVSITDTNSTTKTATATLPSYSTRYVGIGLGSATSNQYGYIKNIKAESLGGGGSDCSQYQTEIANAITYINGSGS